MENENDSKSERYKSVWEWALSLLRERNIERKIRGIEELFCEWKKGTLPILPSDNFGSVDERERKREEREEREGELSKESEKNEERRERRERLCESVPMEWEGAENVTLVDAKHVKAGSKKVSLTLSYCWICSFLLDFRH